MMYELDNKEILKFMKYEIAFLITYIVLLVLMLGEQIYYQMSSINKNIPSSLGNLLSIIKDAVIVLSLLVSFSLTVYQLKKYHYLSYQILKISLWVFLVAEIAVELLFMANNVDVIKDNLSFKSFYNVLWYTGFFPLQQAVCMYYFKKT